MSRLLSTTAALALVAAAAFPVSGMAQTVNNCAQSSGPNAANQQTSAQVADGATCESYVTPSGRLVIQNGPNAQDPDMPDAPHESP